MKFVSEQFKSFIRRTKHYCVYNVLHADDPPHRLALGIAIGMFVTFTPLIGLQMLLAFFLAWLLRANKLVGLPLVWISNPFTIVPIYYPCYWLGCKLMGMPAVNDDWKRIMESWQALSPSSGIREKFGFWWNNLVEVVGPLWVGCMVVATVTGVISYYASLVAIRRYRMRRWGQLMPPGATPIESIDDHQVAGIEGAEHSGTESDRRGSDKQSSGENNAA